jgi:hypothetical protein
MADISFREKFRNNLLNINMAAPAGTSFKERLLRNIYKSDYNDSELKKLIDKQAETEKLMKKSSRFARLIQFIVHIKI